jgi:NAD(P)-dependent dehydrogenase (short-subunit alcohol dehydrogenase family)
MQWTEQHIPDLTGKTVIVTGANGGLGYEATRMFAGKGATVIMAVRTTAKGETAAQQIRDIHPDAKLDVMPLDLADLSSVRAFADAFKVKYDALHILLNNAGVMALPDRRTTADGFEMQFGVNHLGHFALTGLLLDVLKQTPSARVVSVSSFGHRTGRVNFDNLNAEKRYSKWFAYGLSKLANLMFTYELQRRLELAGINALAAAAHPGYTNTNLQQHSGLFSFLNPIFAQAPAMGALPLAYAATAPDVNGCDYIGPGGIFEMRGYPKKVKSSKRSHNEAVAKRLWEVSEELTGVQYAF